VPRWEARDVYDLAIAVVQWDGTVVKLQRWLERRGALSEAQLAEARGYLGARLSQLVCCWGSAELSSSAQLGEKRPTVPMASGGAERSWTMLAEMLARRATVTTR